MATLAETLVRARNRPQGLAWSVVLVVMGSLFVAGLAQLSIKLPFTPVPITGQTLGVLLVGGALGFELGSASLLLYLVEGMVGLPFFAEGKSGSVDLLIHPSATLASGGYLWGFVLAAAIVGLLARRGWDRSIRSSIGAMLIGEIAIYAFGVAWLMSALGIPLAKGLEFGLYPFVVGDTLKLLIAAGLLPAAWRLVGRRPDRDRKS